MATESLCSVFWPWAIAGVPMAKGPVKAGRQEVGLERREVQGLVDTRSTEGVRLLRGRCYCPKIPRSGAGEGTGVWQERGEVRTVSSYELVRSCVTSWLNLLYTTSLEARADKNARTGPSPAPEKRVRAGEVVAGSCPQRRL